MSDRKVYGIVLAAGRATRFGSTKQLQSLHGRPLVAHATALAESACSNRSVLVTGNAWRKVADASAPLQGFFVINERFAEGMSTSIAAGVAAVSHCADAALLLLADQPLIETAHLDALIRRWNHNPDKIVASGFAGTAGPPVVFPRRYFAALCALQGDAGARKLLQDDAEEAVLVVDCPQAATDIDRPDDLAALY